MAGLLAANQPLEVVPTSVSERTSQSHVLRVIIRARDTPKLTPVGKGELETGLQELTDVRPLDVVLLLNLGDPQDLISHDKNTSPSAHVPLTKHDYTFGARLTWTDLNLALCLAAKSWYKASTAPTRESSLNSLYMLWVPDRESYRSQIPKFLTLRGRFSWICVACHIIVLLVSRRFPFCWYIQLDVEGVWRLLTTLTPTISPLAFLTFFNCLKKYQNLDLATTWLGAKILIL